MKCVNYISLWKKDPGTAAGAKAITCFIKTVVLCATAKEKDQANERYNLVYKMFILFFSFPFFLFYFFNHGKVLFNNICFSYISNASVLYPARCTQRKIVSWDNCKFPIDCRGRSLYQGALSYFRRWKVIITDRLTKYNHSIFNRWQLILQINALNELFVFMVYQPCGLFKIEKCFKLLKNNFFYWVNIF